MFNLQDGKLYEARNGQRFRVKYDKIIEAFCCLRSYSGYWYANGATNKSSVFDLVREVEEQRWVPIAFDAIQNGMTVRLMDGQHWYELVTREEAQRRAPNCPQVAKPMQNDPIDLGNGNWFNWSTNVENGKTYLTIETNAGHSLLFAL